MANQVGKQFGAYRLTQLLGKGGFAEVYLGEHIYVGTPAAVKILHAELASGEADNFQREAQIIARLDHPHIVRVLDFDIQDEKPFLIMQYAPHGTLRARHRRGVPVPLETVRAYVRQMADALHYAHEQKLVHRDIKPENMLLGARDEVLLSDFGIAVVSQSSRYQNPQEVVGTVSYMAPEQIQAHPRPPSDQYSLGVVIYEWLTGERPFTGSMREVATKHLVVPPQPLREKVPDLPPAVEQVVLIALAKDYHERFGSMQAFAAAFENACQARAFQRPLPISSQPMANSPGQSLPSITPVVTPPVTLEPTQPASEISAPTDLTTPTIEPAPAAPPAPALPLPSTLARRRLIAAGAGLAGLTLAGGGFAWYLLTHQGQSSAQTQTGRQPAGVPVLKTALLTYRGHSDEVHTVAWSPHDGKYIASGSNDKTVQVWESATGAPLYTYSGHKQFVESVAWSPDGKYLASASRDGTVQVWSPFTKQHIITYTGHNGFVNIVAWSPNGAMIASGGSDGTVQVWDTSGRDYFTYTGQPNGIVALDWSPDGRLIASGGFDDNVTVWSASADTHEAGAYTGYTDAINAIAWSPDGKSIASAASSVQIWSPTTGNTLLNYQGHAAYVTSLAWSADGSRMLSASADQTAHIWSVAVGTPLLIYGGHSAEVYAARWSPDGLKVASGSGDTTVQVWQPGTGA